MGIDEFIDTSTKRMTVPFQHEVGTLQPEMVRWLLLLKYPTDGDIIFAGQLQPALKWWMLSAAKAYEVGPVGPRCICIFTFN